MERFAIIVNGWKPLTIITKRSILDVAAVLDAPLIIGCKINSSLHSTVQIKVFNYTIKLKPECTAINLKLSQNMCQLQKISQ